MDAEHLVLLLMAEDLKSENESEPLDRIRIQKAVFLVEEGGPPSWGKPFEFYPWDWGPYSKTLAATLDRLVADGLITTDPVSFRVYPAYRTTPEGERIARELLPSLSPEERAFIQEVRRYVTTRSFTQLLREVYRAYPPMAAKTKFRG